MRKVLIIEDEFIIARHIKELLEKEGIGCCAIKDTYNESLDWIKKELPDIVLLDIRLFEEKDAGIKIARYLQEHYDIPFIFISGYSDDSTLKNARLYKPATFITKPVIEKQLLAAIRMALPEEDITKIKTVFLKGRYFENVSYEQLVKMPLSNYEFIDKEIRFSDITVIQSFNHVKRNTLLFKFKQPDTFFVMGSTIEKIQEILPSYFKQVHQSFIINIRYITAKRKGHYIMVANEEVPVGSAFKNIV
jgi:DNA-binding LytR/AlgR family response regulator